MTQGAILSHILAFAVPLFLGNVFQQLYNTADCFVVGHFLGWEALAAIGSTSQLILAVIVFFNGFATGMQVVISQCFGAKDMLRLKRAIHTTVFSSVFICILMTLLGLLLSPVLLRLIKLPKNVFDSASSYLEIYFCGISFLILYNIGSGILRALGDSRRPLYFLVFSSLVNIAFDFLFVAVFKWGVRGVAFATVISELVSIIPVFYALFCTGNFYTVSLRDMRIDFPLLFEMLRIGLPGAISASLTAFSNTFMQKYVNAFGAACIAGWAVFARFDQLVIMPMMSISFATTTFVSQNFGANQWKRIQSGVRLSLGVMLLLVALISAFLFVFSKELSAFFVDDAESLRYSSRFIRCTAPFYVLCALCMLFSQILRGLGDSFVPTVITFSGFVLLRQAFLFISTRLTRNFLVVALAYPIVWIFTTVAMLIYYRLQFTMNGMSKRKIL